MTVSTGDAKREEASAILPFFGCEVAELFLRSALFDLDYTATKCQELPSEFTQCSEPYSFSWGRLPISPNSLGASPASDGAPEKTEPGGLGEIIPDSGDAAEMPVPSPGTLTFFF